MTRWRVRASLAEVMEIFRDSESLVNWWPAAFLQVRTVRPGREHEIGKRVWLQTKGWLPYTLRLTFEVVGCEYPESFTLAVDGDFDGGCVCWARPIRGGLELEFDWQVRVRKPVVRYLSWLLKPLFAANHRWVMRRGEESLALEVERRRGGSVVTAPAPPGPTFPFDPVSRRVRSWFAAS